jgi:ribosomal protein S18 acetylase RimI-like enzyme
MQYRNMEIADYAAVFALWQSCEGVGLRDADSSDGIEKYLLRNPGLSFIAERSDRVVGSIMAGHDGKRGYIQHLAVSPGLRNSGIGARLVELCLSALKSEGILKTHIHVFADNKLARDFWLNRGCSERSDIVLFSYINATEGNP